MRNNSRKGISSIKCLNPCCNGIYSMRFYDFPIEELSDGLNPCCNGIYSMRCKCKYQKVSKVQS